MSHLDIARNVRHLLVVAPKSAIDNSLDQIEKFFENADRVTLVPEEVLTFSGLASRQHFPISSVPENQASIRPLMQTRCVIIKNETQGYVFQSTKYMMKIWEMEIDAILSWTPGWQSHLSAAKMADEMGCPLFAYGHHMDVAQNPPVLLDQDERRSLTAQWEINACYTANIYPLLRPILQRLGHQNTLIFSQIGMMKVIQDAIAGKPKLKGYLKGIESHLHAKSFDPGFASRCANWDRDPVGGKDQAIKWIRTWGGRLRRHRDAQWKNMLSSSMMIAADKIARSLFERHGFVYGTAVFGSLVQIEPRYADHLSISDINRMIEMLAEEYGFPVQQTCVLNSCFGDRRFRFAPVFSPASMKQGESLLPRLRAVASRLPPSWRAGAYAVMDRIASPTKATPEIALNMIHQDPVLMDDITPEELDRYRSMILEIDGPSALDWLRSQRTVILGHPQSGPGFRKGVVSMLLLLNETEPRTILPLLVLEAHEIVERSK